MSQKGNSNLKFAIYPLEKSSMLTSLELKSKLLGDLLNPTVLSVKVEVSILCEWGRRRVLPMVGRKWEMWNEKSQESFSLKTSQLNP